ncbi:MAG: hypothetical protein HY941_13555 [Gammaproteobacteria bacterium]|nr:hypothetical protein [Gammaproteobacteria bacterium]
MRTFLFRKSLLATSIALTLGTAHVEAALVTNVLGTNTTYSADSANFTMLSAGGGVVGGTNNVSMAWDGSAFTASSDYTGPGSASNVTISSTAPFFGHSWTAHDIQMFLPGTYSFDVTLGGGTNYHSSTILTATVAPGQLGLHMLWDWKGGVNIDALMVFDINSVFGSGLLYSTQTNSSGQYICFSGFTGAITKNCLWDGGPYGSAGAPVKNQAWMLASADGNGDGIMGIPMIDYAFNGDFSWTFSAFAPTAVPIPATAWLFGSGLLGLVGAARRRKQS